MAKQQKTRSKDYTATDIGDLIQERNKLIVTRENPARLEAIKKILDYYYWGIREK